MTLREFFIVYAGGNLSILNCSLLFLLRNLEKWKTRYIAKIFYNYKHPVNYSDHWYTESMLSSLVTK